MIVILRKINKFRTWLNTTAATPIAVSKLRAVVATSSTGASRLRNSRTRMIRITASTNGMIRALSCCVVVRVSRSVAVAPPMRAVPDSSVRNSRMMSMASSLSAVAVRVASFI